MLGGGSNVLIADAGLDGVVLRPCIGGVQIARTETSASAEVLVHSGAGVEWDELVARVGEAGLAGLECLSGIPGWVGAAPIQNQGQTRGGGSDQQSPAATATASRKISIDISWGQ